jgi:hypothetical protein
MLLRPLSLEPVIRLPSRRHERKEKNSFSKKASNGSSFSIRKKQPSIFLYLSLLSVIAPRNKLLAHPSSPHGHLQQWNGSCVQLEEAPAHALLELINLHFHRRRELGRPVYSSNNGSPSPLLSLSLCAATVHVCVSPCQVKSLQSMLRFLRIINYFFNIFIVLSVHIVWRLTSMIHCFPIYFSCRLRGYPAVISAMYFWMYCTSRRNIRQFSLD